MHIAALGCFDSSSPHMSLFEPSFRVLNISFFDYTFGDWGQMVSEVHTGGEGCHFVLLGGMFGFGQAMFVFGRVAV